MLREKLRGRFPRGMIAAAMALALGGGGLMVHAAPEAQAADRLNQCLSVQGYELSCPGQQCPVGGDGRQ